MEAALCTMYVTACVWRDGIQISVRRTNAMRSACRVMGSRWATPFFDAFFTTGSPCIPGVEKVKSISHQTRMAVIKWTPKLKTWYPTTSSLLT